MEKLRGLRRSSVVSAGVYSPDCEANGEREQSTGGNVHLPGLGNGGALLLNVAPYVVTCKPERRPLGYHPPRGRGEGEGDENSRTHPQKDKEKTGAYLSIELSR